MIAAGVGLPLAAETQLDRGDPAVAARQLEAFFVRQFLAEARPKGGMLDGGFAGDTFHDMLDEAMADAIADAGGLGLATTFESALGGDAGGRTTQGPGLIDQLDGLRALDAGGDAMQRPVAGRYSSGFGRRVDPMGDGHGFHTGLDIAAPTGTPVAAAAAGQVVQAGPAGGYGNMVTLRHADGTETRYAHLSAIDVKVGQQLPAGGAVGAVGSTGRSTGPHLHFEVRRDGKAVDPRPYLDGTASDPAGAATDRKSGVSPLHRQD